jgi:uncharacterized RDD family membrane protein YckC
MASAPPPVRHPRLTDAVLAFAALLAVLLLVLLVIALFWGILWSGDGALRRGREIGALTVQCDAVFSSRGTPCQTSSPQSTEGQYS